jgi:outer membrane protein assembly factor BamB
MKTLVRCAVAAALIMSGGCAHAGSSSLPPAQAPLASQRGAVSRPAVLRAAAVSDNYSATVLAAGPLAYYRLDDTGSTAVDSSPNGLNGTLGKTTGKGVPGLLATSSDTAMSFPGTKNGVISVPVAPLLQVAAQVSLECLFRSAGTAPQAATVIFAYGSDVRSAPYDVFIKNAKLNARFTLSSGQLTVTAPAALQANTTYDVVATFDGTTGRLYVNGVQVKATALAGTIAGYDGTHGLAIGDDAGLADAAFNGTIDEVAIYPNALTANDVAAHYAAASGNVVPSGYADWSTFGFDGARSGNNPVERTLSSSNTGGLKLLWSYGFKEALGDAVLAQPVLATGVTTPTGNRNLVYVGASTGEFDAFDADSGALVWQKMLPSIRYSCGGTSTATTSVDRAATFDRTTNRIYVEDGTDSIHAFDLGTGTEQAGWPVTLANATPGLEFPHGGLNYDASDHLLYATTSSTCDITPWNGRVAVVDTQAAAQTGVFFTVPGPNGTTVPANGGGGIWGDGGVSIDPLTHNVFAAVGNADTSSGSPQNSGYGENVIELSSGLSLIAANNPSLPDEASLNDLDFGATPTLFQPPGCTPMAAAMNKSGVLALYDRTNVAAGPLQLLAMNPPTDNADFVGLPAYSPKTNLLYVPLPANFKAPGATYTRGMAALRFQGCSLQASPVWNASFGISVANKQFDVRHSPPTIANGVVFISDGPGQTLYAFDASSGKRLWTSGKLSDTIYTAPVVDKNVYVTDLGTLYAFGLPASANAAAVAAGNTAVLSTASATASAVPRRLGTIHTGPQPRRPHHVVPLFETRD